MLPYYQCLKEQQWRIAKNDKHNRLHEPKRTRLNFWSVLGRNNFRNLRTMELKHGRPPSPDKNPVPG